MTAFEQAQRYIAKIDGAISGNKGHDVTFEVACYLMHGFALPRSDARMLLDEFNGRCQPSWSERELEHKLTQAEACKTHKHPRGHMLSKRITHVYNGDYTPPRTIATAETSKPAKNGKVKRYEVNPSIDLPKPLEDATRELIRAAFEPGEGVRIAEATRDNDKIPVDAGLVLTREEWLRKLDEVGGDINRKMTARNGIFVSMNPMRAGGKRDDDVTAFRHVLIESDKLSEIEQWRHIVASGVPVTAVIRSGGKSVHAWVRVDARDKTEHAARFKIVFDYLVANGFTPDDKNKNPSRFSRLPGCVRGKNRQELLSLKIGADSFGAWMSELETDSIGRVITIDTLRKFKAEEDPSCLIGARWLCRGGSCLFVGPSGVGKSSLSVQAAISWALNRPLFGIPSRRPLKSVFIQAENDDGDLAEMVQGVLSALGIEPGSAEDKQVTENVIFISDASHTGEQFTKNVQKIVDRYSPDLCWFDPMLSFIGDDISKQSVCSQFLRNWLAPISETSGVTWMVMHHAGKPKEDNKGRKNWTKTDQSYAGLGSSEIVNWARAVCILERIDDKNFCLLLAKRGKRAEARDVNGELTERIWLQHAEKRIEWVQVKEPKKPVKEPRNTHKVAATERSDQHKALPGDTTILDKLRDHLSGFCAGFGSEKVSLRESVRRFISFASLHDVNVGETQARECIDMMIGEGRLRKSPPTKKGGPCEIFI